MQTMHSAFAHYLPIFKRYPCKTINIENDHCTRDAQRKHSFFEQELNLNRIIYAHKIFLVSLTLNQLTDINYLQNVYFDKRLFIGFPRQTSPFRAGM
jgi:hypothetical protein